MTSQEFVNPGPAYRAKPFWSWNGLLEEDELLRQVDCIEEMGFGGFFMHSRTGLQTEYLGEEWFRLINACADYAEKKGLESWLYDEDRWPSGLAGGLVTEGHPEYWMKAVKMEELPIGSAVEGDFLAVFSCRLDGNNLLDYAPYNGALPEGHNRLLTFRVINTDAHPVYNGAGYVDTMNPEAIRSYLSITHEAYQKHCGERMGKSIKGIFTDEPHRGTLMDTFGSSNGNDNHRIPWTPALAEEFAKRFGYDLVAKRPALYHKPKGSSVAPVKRDYVECCQQLFLEAFMEPINRWCEEHGIILTGHVLHEDCLTAQTVMNGSMMRNYEHMGYPGVDVLSGYNFNYWIVKQIASACRQLGKPWILSELYGCSGWQMKLEDYKRSGDWQALFGVNLRCPHLSWYTMEGEGKRDFPATIFFQSAWYREYRALEDYYARIGLVMSQGEADCHLLVLSPWRASGARSAWATPATSPLPPRKLWRWRSNTPPSFTGWPAVRWTSTMATRISCSAWAASRLPPTAPPCCGSSRHSTARCW
ncbi:MAG: glycosyl hydrolase [Oscillospiraceae bacterium]